mgnify:CR=1 FL=1
MIKLFITSSKVENQLNWKSKGEKNEIWKASLGMDAL